MSNIISVRLDDKVYNNLLEQSKKLNINLSDLVRKRLSNKKQFIIKNDDDLKQIELNKLYELNKLNNEISRIGNNLNQIAKYVNYNNELDELVKEDLNQIKIMLQQIYKGVKNDS
jgi:hypothetical protein